MIDFVAVLELEVKITFTDWFSVMVVRSGIVNFTSTVVAEVTVADVPFTVTEF